MKINECSTQKNSRMLLESVTLDMTKKQKYIVEGIVKEFRPLIEATLTPQQIGQIFAAAEQGAASSGKNRTLVGKGVDTAKVVNNTINKVGKWLQNTAPVQGFDAKFEQLKNTINQKFPDSKLLDGISQMGIWAKENPGKTAAIIGVLTAIASLAAGPVGGAIAGQVLKGSAELLKGEKLSTAVGKGIKAAGVGALAGMSLEAIGDALGQGATTIADQVAPGTVTVDMTTEQTGLGLKFVYATGTPEDARALKEAFNTASNAWFDGDFELAREKFGEAYELSARMNSEEYLENLEIQKETRSKILAAGRSSTQALKGLAATAQGALTAATGNTPQQRPAAATESKYIDTVQTNRFLLLSEALGYTRSSVILTEEGVNAVFNSAINEGPLDAVKGAVGKAASAVANKVSKVGKNLTNKVTADKLNAAWKKAGSPTDSDKIAALLKQAGVSDTVIASTYQSLNIPTPVGVQQSAPAQQSSTQTSPRTSMRNFAPGRSTRSATAPQSSPAQEPQPAQEPETQYDKFKRLDRENQRREKQLQKQQSNQQRLGTATIGNPAPTQGSSIDEPLLIGLLTAAKTMSPEKIASMARATIQLNKTKGNLTSQDLSAILRSVK